MASKNAASGKEKLIDEEQEILQAVVLADSWNRRFRPLTTKKPRCLLPICNAPLLDWTFESLALAGVQEVFVICRSYSEQIKDAIKKSKWSRTGSGMKIVPIMTAKETYSAGDAMRDIYTRGLVTGDFILVQGDLVSNIQIDEVVRVHKERRKTNKDAILTMVVKEAGVQHRTRSRGDSPIFVVDSETSECLHYEPSFAFPKKQHANIPREVLAEHKEVEIRYDLIDCGIDVCSFEVPSLFQDNFDYLDMRRDFVHGVLTSDLLMKNIHVFVAKDGYAARVQDTRSYESISKDILSRWTFPLVPDDNYPGSERYQHTGGNQYVAKTHPATISRTAKIGRNTLIGSSTRIHDNAEIIGSVVGPNCTIGAGSVIENAYIFEGTTVGAECRVTRSIVGSGVEIRDGSTVERGSLIGDGVVIGPGAKLKPFERLSVPWKAPASTAGSDEDDDEDSDIEDIEASQDTVDKASLGPESNAVVWIDKPPEDDDLDSPENYNNLKYMRLGEDDVTLDVHHSDKDTESVVSEEQQLQDSSDEEDNYDDHTDAESVVSLSKDTQGGLMADKEFRSEVNQSLERAFAEGHSVDNAAVELKTLRMASNVPLIRVKEAVVAAIVEKIPVLEGAAEQRMEVNKTIARWGQLINRIGGVDPVETISLLQRHISTSARMSLFGQILAAFYQTDVVEEDDIRAWHSLSTSQGIDLPLGEERENMGKAWIVGAHMIHQLDQQSDSEEEGSDEDEESD
ncbi:hypothetical protein D9611_004610 [Ephemerocybe angulata]|uniref:Translation initiation factor eIF2B subunit epsilon n=1 Tax=Ephemerocybe angulata TaxID=980116 RepID=A0A8H5EX58_9AGAR|nr:hypothetical protein D9611_004610 [Tulosesus angulatus]